MKIFFGLKKQSSNTLHKYVHRKIAINFIHAQTKHGLYENLGQEIKTTKSMIAGMSFQLEPEGDYFAQSGANCL